MAEVLQKYSVVIGADTKELMEELNKAEKELNNRLKNIDIGAGVRSSLENLQNEIKTLKAELKDATKDINNSIAAINTDALKGQFKDLQEIISGDVKGLEERIKSLTDSINILNNKAGLDNLKGSFDDTLTSISQKMGTILEEFKVFHQFTQDLRIGAIDTSALDNALKNTESTVKKTTKKQKEYLTDLIDKYAVMADDIVAALSGASGQDIELSQYTAWLNILKNIVRESKKIDSDSLNEIFGTDFNLDVIKKQMNAVDEYITDSIAKISDDVSKKSDHIYIRWKTEIDPNVTANDIIKGIDEKYTKKINKWLEDHPLKLHLDKEALEKEFEKSVKEAIKAENTLLQDPDAPKLQIGIDMSHLSDSDIKKAADKINENLNANAGDVNASINGGTVNIKSENLAQESTLSEIKDILTNWQSSGMPGVQSKEKLHQDAQAEKELLNARYLVKSGRLNLDVTDQAQRAAREKKLFYTEREYLVQLETELKKITKIGAKRLTKNPSLIEKTGLYNDSVEVNGVKYAKWTDELITIEDWQKKLKAEVSKGTIDFFKDAVKQVQRRTKAKTETLRFMGVEIDQNTGKILGRDSTAIGENDMYKNMYAKVNKLKKDILEGDDGLSVQYETLQLMERRRTLMQQIVQLAEKDPDSEQLATLKEQLRVVTQVCKDEEKYNSLIKERTDLETRFNNNDLDKQGFDRLREIETEIGSLWEDASDDMIAYSRGQLDVIDTTIDNLKQKVKELTDSFYKQMHQIHAQAVNEFGVVKKEKGRNRNGELIWEKTHLNITSDEQYNSRLEEWKALSKEFEILNASSNGGKDYSALLDTEKQRYSVLYNSLNALGDSLNLYREMRNAQLEAIGSEKRFGEELESNRKTTAEIAKQTTKIIAPLYKDGRTEAEGISRASDEELAKMSEALGNVKSTSSTAIDKELENRTKNYIKERTDFLINTINKLNVDINDIVEKGGNSEGTRNLVAKLMDRRNAAIDDLVKISNIDKRQQEEVALIDSIKEENNLNDSQVEKLKELLRLSIEINKENQKKDYYKSIVDKEYKTGQKRDNEISKRRAAENATISDDRIKSLKAMQGNILQSIGLPDLENDLSKTLTKLIENGIDSIPDGNIATLLSNMIENAFVLATKSNIFSVKDTLLSDTEVAASTKARIDAEIERREKLKEVQAKERSNKKEEHVYTDNEIDELINNAKKNEEIVDARLSEIEAKQKELEEIDKVNRSKKGGVYSDSENKNYREFIQKENEINQLEKVRENRVERIAILEREIENIKKKDAKSPIINELNSEIELLKSIDNLPNKIALNEQKIADLKSGKLNKSNLIAYDENGGIKRDLTDKDVEEAIVNTEQKITEQKQELIDKQKEYNKLLEINDNKIREIEKEQNSLIISKNNKSLATRQFNKSNEIASEFISTKAKYQESFNAYGESEDTLKLGDELIKIKDKYIHAIMQYLSAGGDKTLVNDLFYNIDKETESISSHHSVLIRETEELKKQALQQKDLFHTQIESLKDEKNKLEILKEQKEYIESLKDEYKLANTPKSKREKEDDLFSYYSGNSVTKGMTEEQKYASFKVDYQLAQINPRVKALEYNNQIMGALLASGDKDGADELQKLADEVKKNLKEDLALLKIFRDEAVDAGLHISETTGRAVLDVSKDSVVLAKDMYTGLDQVYKLSAEQQQAYRDKKAQDDADEAKRIQEKKELEQAVHNAKINDIKTELTAESEAAAQKKKDSIEKYYAGMNENERKLAQDLYNEQNKLSEMYRRKNKYSKEDRDAQQQIVDKLKEQVEQSERLVLTETKQKTKRGRSYSVFYANLKGSEFANNETSASSSYSSTAPATEGTLLEIRDILKNGTAGKLGQQQKQQQQSKENGSKQKFIFPKNDSEWKQYWDLMRKGGVELKETSTKGHFTYANKNRDAKKIEEIQKEWNAAHQKNTKETNNDTKAKQDNAAETKKNTDAKQKNTEKIKKDTNNNFDKELYKKVAKDNNLLNKNGSVSKSNRGKVYLEMEKLKPGSSGLSEDKLKELRDAQASDVDATKENVKAKEENTAETKKETQAKKDNQESSKKESNAKKDNAAETTKEVRSKKDNVESSSMSMVAKNFKKEFFYEQNFDTLKSIGKETIKKFYEGAEAESDAEKEAFKKLSEIPVEVIRKYLNIDSPSKVMEELGFWTEKGFEKGVIENLDTLKQNILNALKSQKIKPEDIDELLNPDYVQSDPEVQKHFKNVKATKGYKAFTSVWGDKSTRAAIVKEANNYKNAFNNNLADLFNDKNGNIVTSNKAASIIKKNGEEVIDAIKKYNEELVASGYGEQTLQDVIQSMFGNEQDQKVVSSAFNDYFSKLAKDQLKDIEALGKINLKFANGKVDNELLGKKQNLDESIKKRELLLEKLKEILGTSEQITAFEEQRTKLESQNSKNLETTLIQRNKEELQQLQNIKSTNGEYEKQVQDLEQLIMLQEKLASGDFNTTDKTADNYVDPVVIEHTRKQVSAMLNTLKGFADNPDMLTGIGGDPHAIEAQLLRMNGIKKESVQIRDNGKVIVGTLELANKQTKTLEYRWNDVLKMYIESTKVLTSQLSIWDRMKAQLKKSWEYLKSYLGGYLTAQRLISTFRQGFQYVKELDAALTEMRKVSDESIASLKRFQDQSFETAKAIGVTAVEVQKSAADFMRLGYSLKEASQLAKDANIYANVGDMQISEATEHMISSIQAWQSEFSSATEASTAIIDKYNEIGNNYAITSADIGSAMERSAAALKAGGNTLNEAIGLITAGNLIQQDADTTANALKVMSLRLRGAKADLESMGEETDDLVDSSSKLRNELKALTGVDIMLDKDTFKSTAQIIQEIGENWDRLTDVSKSAALEKIAGKTRASTVAGLIENYKTISQVAEDAANAQGSAARENEKYVDSIAGRTAILTSQFQEFWHVLLDSDAVKVAITSLTGLLNVLTKLTETMGGFGTIGVVGGAIAGFKNLGRNKKFFLIICQGSRLFYW